MASFLNTLHGEYLDFEDVLIVPQPGVVNSRSEVDLFTDIRTKVSLNTIASIPIIIANMDSTGTNKMANETENYCILTAFHKYEKNVTTKGGFSHFVSFGMEESLDDIAVKAGSMHYILLDVANAYMPAFLDRVKAVRQAFPHKVIAAGNVVTIRGVQDLIDAGVDIVKIGIGPGGQCRTREVAGVGMPQFTAVEDCSRYAHNAGIFTIADGGIVQLADFAKAFVAGADFVMAGSIFAGYDEAGGERIYDASEGTFYKEIYGMSSNKAMHKYDKLASHRASEGRVSRIPWRGTVHDLIPEILGALKSTVSYSGCANLQDLHKKAIFIKVNNTHNRHYEQYTVGK